MAGDHGLKTDPAIERWVAMRHNRHNNFHWTPRTTKHAFILLGVVPFAIYQFSYWIQDKIQLKGKLRGEALWINKD